MKRLVLCLVFLSAAAAASDIQRRDDPKADFQERPRRTWG
jgi:hypothetical protein